MPRSCSICDHHDVAEIDVALRAGAASLRRIAAQAGVSPTSLRRHREHVSAPVAVVGPGQTAGPNVTAAATVIGALRDNGKLEDQHEAEVAHVLQLAGARDEQPASASLAREYRLALAQLMDRVDTPQADDQDVVHAFTTSLLMSVQEIAEAKERVSAVALDCGLPETAAGRIAAALEPQASIIPRSHLDDGSHLATVVVRLQRAHAAQVAARNGRVPGVVP